MSRTALYRLPLESIEKRRTVRTGDINLPCWSNTRSPVSYHSQQLVFRCHSSLNMAAIGHVAYLTGHLQACHEALLYLPFCCVSVKRKENKTAEAVTEKKEKSFHLLHRSAAAAAGGCIAQDWSVQDPNGAGRGTGIRQCRWWGADMCSEQPQKTQL